eukprot:COSAG01_NODE_7_length_54400_cov_1218.054935_29_plen_280_part_00
MESCLLNAGYEAFSADPFETDDWLHKCDIVFNTVHGTFGEDGQLQALLNRAKIPYTGSNIQASILCMNKLLCKKTLQLAKLPYIPYRYHQNPCQNLSEGWQYPVIIKPIDQGSSIDVYLIQNDQDLQEKSHHLHQKYQQYLIEPFIAGKELTVGILETPKTIALPILELNSHNAFYDYEAKYTKGLTDFIIPAEIPPSVTQELHDIALKAHQALGCYSVSRVDFRLDPKMKPFILEINTLPGLTETSDLPAQAQAQGIPFLRLIEYLLTAALRRHELKR